MKNYQSTINNLTQILNNGRSKKGQNIGEEFKQVVKELHDGHGQSISTKFLRNLVNLEKSNRQKSLRVNYLISKAGLKTERNNRYIFGWTSQIWNTYATEYAHNENGLIYQDELTLSEDEQKQINQINEVKQKHNIELFSIAESEFNERQQRRTAINKGGGVYIKEVKPVQVGKFFKANSKEVLFFISL